MLGFFPWRVESLLGDACLLTFRIYNIDEPRVMQHAWARQKICIIPFVYSLTNFIPFIISFYSTSNFIPLARFLARPVDFMYLLIASVLLSPSHSLSSFKFAPAFANAVAPNFRSE